MPKAKDYSVDERDKMAKSGTAMPDGSYPIANETDLQNAISSYGRAKDKEAAKAHIIKRAKALKKTDLLPADWEGSTKEAAEPDSSDVHVPAPAQSRRQPSMAFYKKMYAKLKEMVGDSVSEEDFKAAFLHARAHAGGSARAEKQKAMSDMSYTRLIEMVNAALCESFKKPFSNESYFYWAREIYPDYVIVCSNDDGKFYKIPYTITDDDVEFDDPQEVEQTFAPITSNEVDILDLCADGHGARLFNELQEFADPPDWIPYLPKPGTYTSPRYGEIKITKKRVQNFVKNFEDKVYQEKLPIDAEHETKLSGALGWITELRINDDGSVDARAEWTDRGTQLIEADRFKYFSPEWFEEWTDPATEEKYKDVAVGGALTTRPFFKETSLRPLVASERGLEETNVEPSRLSDTTTIIFTALAPVKEREANAMAENTATAATGAKLVDEPKETQNFAELKAKLDEERKAREASEAEAKKANERIASLEKEGRTRRFTAIVRDSEGDGSKRFIGDEKKHVEFLEKLSENFGETSDEVQHYVTEQQAHAEQVRSSNLFKEVGREGDSKPSAFAEMDAKAKERAKEKKVSYAVAFDEIMVEEPELYKRSLTEEVK